jgi:hypothetical protein
MAYQVLTLHDLYRQAGTMPSKVSPGAGLEAALNNQKSERGMVLVAIDHSHEDGPLYIFNHETD